jgi:glutamate carboxypeptidase
VGVIKGGTVANATPNYARIKIDVRFVAESAVAKFTKQLEDIATRTYVP